MDTHTHIYDFIHNSVLKIAPSIRHILEKIAILFIPLPILMLFLGTEGIIKQDSPDSLATIGSLGSSFFNSFEMHTLILAGAFGITFIIWVVTRNLWSQSEEELEDEFEQEYYNESSRPSCEEEEVTPQLLQKKISQ